METIKKDKKVKDWVESVDGLCFEVFNDPDGKYGKFIADLSKKDKISNLVGVLRNVVK